jgi:hypothetical protein
MNIHLIIFVPYVVLAIILGFSIYCWIKGKNKKFIIIYTLISVFIVFIMIRVTNISSSIHNENFANNKKKSYKNILKKIRRNING